MDPNLFYGVIGNHDAGLRGASWFQKWVDPIGQNTAHSGVDNSLRPYPVTGTWEHYSFDVGNVRFLMLGDRNFGGPPFGKQELADRVSADGLDETQAFIGPRDFGFKQYLEEHPGAIAMWLFGHTHRYMYPGKVFNGRADIEPKHGVIFANLLTVNLSHGGPAVPASRLLQFFDGEATVRIKTYLHQDWLGKEGFDPAQEKTWQLDRRFQR